MSEIGQFKRAAIEFRQINSSKKSCPQYNFERISVSYPAICNILHQD